MENNKYKCLKCENVEYVTGEIRAASGFWTKIFNIQNKKFITVSCKKCGYTELYSKENAKSIENIFDFFTN